MRQPMMVGAGFSEVFSACQDQAESRPRPYFVDRDREAPATLRSLTFDDVEDDAAQ